MALYPPALPSALPAILNADGSNLNPSDPCNYVEYDGVDDYYISNEGVLQAGGDFTWCCEANINSVQANATVGIMADSTNVTHGAQLLITGGNTIALYGYSNGLKNTTIPVSSFDQWVTIVVTWNGSGNVTLWVDGISSTPSATSGTIAAAGSPFFAIGTEGTDSAGREYTGGLRNIEIYSGYTTDGSVWIPGDVNSLSGPSLSLLMQAKGDVQSNEQSLLFTKYGNPQVLAC
jgi:hypothetical protein